MGDFLCPAAEHRHARPAALGAGIESKVIAAVQDGINRIRAQRFELLNAIGADDALHVCKNDCFSFGQLPQLAEVRVIS